MNKTNNIEDYSSGAKDMLVTIYNATANHFGEDFTEANLMVGINKTRYCNTCNHNSFRVKFMAYKDEIRLLSQNQPSISYKLTWPDEFELPAQVVTIKSYSPAELEYKLNNIKTNNSKATITRID